LQQFDIPNDGEDVNDLMRELAVLAGDLKFEEESLRGESDEGEEDDDVEGLKDEQEDLSEANRKALDIQPVQCVLVKVRK
jgi:hypothetical protein